MQKLIVLLLLLLTGGALTGSVPYAAAASVRDGFWVTNGNVRAEQLVGSTLYVGGDFSYLGPEFGHAVALDPGSGAGRTAFARIGGTVAAVVSDGDGGWFVGGTLTTAGGLSLGSLVHVRADGSVDASFAPRPRPASTTRPVVRALALANGVLYVGGSFTTIGGVSRTDVAALDPATGAVT